MTTTTQQTTADLLQSIAKSDLGYARRTLAHLVAQTRHGLLSVEFDRSTKLYTITVQGNPTREPLVLVENVKAAAARACLVDSYDVSEG